MPIDPSSDITFEELIASYSHTKPGSFYFELFEEAAWLLHWPTSVAIKPSNTFNWRHSFTVLSPF